MEKIINYKNRGMLLEQIINNSIDFYYKNNIALIHKITLPIKLLKKNENEVKAILYAKSTVDYYGVYKKRYICFEAKSTNEDFLLYKNIKSHQHKYLLNVKNFGGFSFYILFFKKKNSFFMINPENLNFEKENKISYTKIKKIGIELTLTYPGILNFIDYIN